MTKPVKIRKSPQPKYSDMGTAHRFVIFGTHPDGTKEIYDIFQCEVDLAHFRKCYIENTKNFQEMFPSVSFELIEEFIKEAA